MGDERIDDVSRQSGFFEEAEEREMIGPSGLHMNVGIQGVRLFCFFYGIKCAIQRIQVVMKDLEWLQDQVFFRIDDSHPAECGSDVDPNR